MHTCSPEGCTQLEYPGCIWSSGGFLQRRQRMSVSRHPVIFRAHRHEAHRGSPGPQGLTYGEQRVGNTACMHPSQGTRGRSTQHACPSVWHLRPRAHVRRQHVQGGPPGPQPGRLSVPRRWPRGSRGAVAHGKQRRRKIHLGPRALSELCPFLKQKKILFHPLKNHT